MENVARGTLLGHFSGQNMDMGARPGYFIVFRDYVRKMDDLPNGDFVIIDGHIAQLPTILKKGRFYGNSRMIQSSPEEMKATGWKRLIRVNDSHVFLGAMLFMKNDDGKIYRLAENHGFLQLHIGTRKTPKIIKSLKLNEV